MSTLLQWCTLESQGPSGLAAVRFPDAVHIHTINIFPTDSRPFQNKKEIVARTEPEAFFLELYFNYYPIAAPGSKEKPKPTNALIPTTLAYAGGQMSFSVGMGKETATRLMIVGGSFEAVSMAIYGEYAKETSPLPDTYVPKNIMPSEPPPIAKALDPSMARDPTQLARQLLNLIPNAPPLSLIIRLMFCLKVPNDDDWDLPDFPYLYPSLDQDPATFDLEQAKTLTKRPIAEDTKPQQMQQFADMFATVISNSREDQDPSYVAKLVAKILKKVSSQMPDFPRIILQSMDFSSIFDAQTIGYKALDKLADAVGNPDICRHFHVDWFLGILDSISKDLNNDRDTRLAAKQLITRLGGWSILEDTLSNTQGDFVHAVDFIADVSSQEASFGAWLVAMVTHEDLVTKLSENPVIPTPTQYPPFLLKRNKPSVSHDEYIAFLRAFVGVACVLAVYAWADSLPDKHCRERALGIIRLWQGIDGYREILNHLLLLPQMIFRLECMLDEDLPTKVGIDAEQILVGLAQNPQSFLRGRYIKCILTKLQPPHTFITHDERMSLRYSAYIADDGLMGAVEELTQPVEHPPTLKVLRGIRVALAVIEREFNEDGEYNILKEFWKDGSRSFLGCLVDVFLEISNELGKHFTVSPPPVATNGSIAWLFATCDDLLRLIDRLAPEYPFPGPAIRSLITSVANTFFCSDAVDMIYSQSSPACIAAQETRQVCIDVTRTLATVSPDGRKPGAIIVLRTLLEHGLRCEDRDPAHHLLQVFGLIDYLLPMSDADGDLASLNWTQKIMPSMLKEIWAFCRILDTENKAHFVRRIVGLDETNVGIGEWVLQEELKEVLEVMHILLRDDLNDGFRYVKQYQVANSIRLLLDLASSTSAIASWFVRSIGSEDGLVQTFGIHLRTLLELGFISNSLVRLAELLAAQDAVIEKELHQPLALILLKGCANLELSSSSMASSLQDAHKLFSGISQGDVNTNGVKRELGALLSHLQTSPHASELDVAEALVEILFWFTVSSDSPSVNGISSEALAQVTEKLKQPLSSERKDMLEGALASILIDEDIELLSVPTILSDSLEFSVHALEDLLHTEPPVPSTPPRKPLSQDVLSLVTVSPPTALIRSPAATGLTKTYLNNDFRQLRQTPSARQNTSRLPSMHVDDFESVSPTMSMDALPSTTGMIGITMGPGSPVAGTIPFAASTSDVFPGLGLAPGFQTPM